MTRRVVALGRALVVEFSPQGMPVRVEARARLSESELTGVAGANCYVLRQVVRDRLGARDVATDPFSGTGPALSS